ncbi:MAG: phage tail sheath C-terminal domain-containing protein [Actinomycetota bacterium]
MSEAIREMIVPGTFIEVRAEGLIGVGSIATGNIGIVGTAARGPVNEVRGIGSYSEALDLYGDYDPASTENALTLNRALEQAFGNGAGNVFAVRIANGEPATASLPINTEGGDLGFTLTAVEAGSWANAITVRLTEEVEGDTSRWKLSLTHKLTTEVFEGADLAAVHTALATSTLVTVDAIQNPADGFTAIDPATSLTGGTDGADVSSVDVAAGLALLEDQPVNIVLTAGLGSTVVRSVVGAHLEQTENDGRERLAVVGVSSSGAANDPADPIAEVGAISDDRIILCAPGLRTTDAATGDVTSLPAAYMAAAVAGKLSTLAPHISLTNATVNVGDLEPKYNTTAVTNLLLNRMLVVRQKQGFQVVRGISTDPGPFTQISVRRIVDFAKAGVRLGSDPYIGRLNNSRVRGALKATLDGFLSEMVLSEMLVGYELEVSATRAQEIQGIAAVTMTLQPTFSIDFIRVTMNLQ